MLCHVMSCHVMYVQVRYALKTLHKASLFQFHGAQGIGYEWPPDGTCISHAFAVAASSHSPCKPPNNEPAKGEKKGWRETLKRGGDDGGLGLQSRGRVG